MSINLSWHTPLRVIHSHIIGEPGYEQMQHYLQDMCAYLNEGIAPIHLIIDNSYFKPGNYDLRSFQSLFQSPISEFEKIGWIINIGDHAVLPQLIFSRWIEVGQMGYVSVRSMNEAVNRLQILDNSLSCARIC